ncbi:hypothetical protein J7384_08715 [Endozoicomonas sp. G2_1]|uniref:hypothetical protein n=1 Tax=Endozoicomonas sp. G2_1 TaxID=2821091 RepID=UPI001ADAF1C7|nr:hypothetical protein [Endozoicomonas sp. G2_1]MBO9490442.1 hypothetical protein [Endozoicomonas sp. G2_1]
MKNNQNGLTLRQMKQIIDTPSIKPFGQSSFSVCVSRLLKAEDRLDKLQKKSSRKRD